LRDVQLRWQRLDSGVEVQDYPPMSNELEEIQAKLRSVLVHGPKASAPLPGPVDVSELLERGKALYGGDNRVEPADASGIPPEVIAAVCVLVPPDRLQPAPGGYLLKTEAFGPRYNLCSGQRFREQPLLGYGSGFLVAPDVIATAGHCVLHDGIDPLSACVLFDFEVRGGGVERFRPISAVYFMTEVLKATVESHGADYALVRLDRPVTGIGPLRIRPERVADHAPIYVVGHPVGLPKKVARGARVLDNKPATHFLANLHTFGGNSGSPVLTEQHEVCGILVRGAPDFVYKGDCVVATEFPLEQAGESVCRASVWHPAMETSKLSRLAEASSGAASSARPASAPVNKRVRLEDFLLAAFSTNDLKRLAWNYPLLEPVYHRVAWDAAPVKVVTEMIEALEQKNLISRDFFMLLASERPHRAKEIEQLRALWGL
jgi:hypothetical protein